MQSLDDRVRGVEGILNYHFTKPQTIREALYLAGAGSYPMEDGNKKLALVGDGIIKTVLIADGYKARQTRMNISNIVNTVGSNNSLSLAGFTRNLEQFIYKNQSQNDVSMKSMATTVEAIVGAVYLDSNENHEITKRAMAALGIM